MTQEMTCICCPIGCHIRVEIENGQVKSVEGNSCPRGENYARQEAVCPVRVVTGTVPLTDGGRISVRTQGAVPKSMIFDVMKEIHAVRVSAPVKIGDVLIEDIAGTGIHLIATKNA